MLHLAIPSVDEGPPVAFCRYPLHGPSLDPLWAQLDDRIDALDDGALEQSALFAAIRGEGMRYEAPLLLATIAEFAAGQLRATAGRVLGADGAPREPADLTGEVSARLAGL